MSLCLVIFSLTSVAGSLNEKEAKKIAESFVKNKQMGNLVPHVNVRKVKMARKTFCPYYVFNIENEKGFVIIAGDDRMETILGYTDNGHFDEKNIPDGLQYLLDGYTTQLEWLESEGIKAPVDKRAMTSAKAPVATRREIAPLVAAKWNQGDYYTNHTYLNKVTGCVATAMAQVIYANRWPVDSVKAMPAYTNGNDGQPIEALPARQFNYDIMPALTDANASDEAKDEVAWLMRYCGQSVNMSYGPEMSSAVTAKISTSLKTYFNYDSEGCFLNRTGYSIDDWDEIIYGELAAGRPLVYSGASPSGGHAFVCDGYQDGLYHINWGWGGSSDGYYKLSVLNPGALGIGGGNSSDGFTNGQGACIGIQKAVHPEPEPEVEQYPDRLSVTGVSLPGDSVYYRSSASTYFASVSVKWEVRSHLEGTQRYRWGFDIVSVADDGTETLIERVTPNGWYGNIGKGGGFYSMLSLSRVWDPGHYKIVSVSGLATSDNVVANWYPSKNADGYYFDMWVEDTVLHIKAVTPYDNLNNRLTVTEVYAPVTEYTRTSSEAAFANVLLSTDVYHLYHESQRYEFGLQVASLGEGDVETDGDVLSGSTAANMRYMSSFSYMFKVISLNLSPGRYKIVPVCRISGSNKWLRQHGSDKYYFLAEVDETSLRLTLSKDDSSLELESATPTGGVVTGSVTEIDACIRNNGLEYNGELSMLVDGRAARNKMTVALQGNSTEHIFFHFTPATAGYHTVTICKGDTLGRPIGQAVVHCSDISGGSPENANLSFEVNVLGATDNHSFTGHMYVGVKVKNVGSTVYKGTIIPRLYCEGAMLPGMQYTKSDVIIAPGATKSYPAYSMGFHKNSLQEGKEYYIVVNYQKDDGTVDYIDSVRYRVASQLAYTAEGTSIGVTLATDATSYAAPASVAYIDLTPQGNLETLTKSDNPNCLYEFSSAEAVPEGFDGNVVVNDSIEQLDLVDEATFYTPKALTVQHISYSRTFEKGANGDGKNWSTIVLPFSPTSITVDGREVDWFHSSEDTGKNFWLREFSADEEGTVYFDHVQTIEANRPYIIAVPGDRWGDEWNLEGKTLVFSTDRETVIESCKMSTVYGSNYHFVGSNIQQSLSDIYTLNDDGNRFVLGSTTVTPFRSYFKAVASSMASSLAIGSLTDNTATALPSLPLESLNLETDAVYSLTGVRMNKQLPKGIYIIKGKKKLVR